MHVISPRATINISKCIITGRIVAVEQTPFSAALEEDWLAPVISSLTFAFSEHVCKVSGPQRDFSMSIA